MSRITQQDVDLMNFWEVEFVHLNWEEFDYDSDIDVWMCSKCETMHTLQELESQWYWKDWDARCKECNWFFV